MRIDGRIRGCNYTVKTFSKKKTTRNVRVFVQILTERTSLPHVRASRIIRTRPSRFSPTFRTYLVYSYVLVPISKQVITKVCEFGFRCDNVDRLTIQVYLSNGSRPNCINQIHSHLFIGQGVKFHTSWNLNHSLRILIKTYAKFHLKKYPHMHYSSLVPNTPSWKVDLLLRVFLYAGTRHSIIFIFQIGQKCLTSEWKNFIKSNYTFI